jgi:hypothetical protein
MRNLIPFLLPLLLSVAACSNVKFAERDPKPECEIGEFSKQDLVRIKQSEFKGITSEELNAFALDLLPCVGSPDPEMRDGIVYESLSFLLRNDRLANATKTELMTTLLTALKGPDDKSGYLKPFAALNLSELARADRIEPYLTEFQRAELVSAAADYLTKIDDYRGYDDHEGWRHGVAHTADLALQLVLNDKVIEPQIRALRHAIATQIAPESGHGYIHGESERLARPILFMARRGEIIQEDWDSWFKRLADPAPFGAWGDVYKSESGLAKLHNTKAFLNAIYVNTSASQNEQIQMLRAGALDALKQLP